MTKIIFPRRNLGVSEDWGRAIEERVQGISSSLDLSRQVVDNIERTTPGRRGIIAREIETSRGIINQLDRQNELISERISRYEGNTSVRPDSFGPSITVEKPSWARAAVVIASLDAISNPGTGWLARIDVYTETEPISSGNIDEHRVIAQGSMGHEPGAPVDPLDHLSYLSLPGVRFFEEFEDTLYVRPYGVQVGGGSTSVTHQFSITLSIFWVGS